jgi:hypothetical protein
VPEPEGLGPVRGVVLGSREMETAGRARWTGGDIHPDVQLREESRFAIACSIAFVSYQTLLL